jgi:hypothetical protein
LLLVPSDGIKRPADGIFGDRGHIFIGQAVILPPPMFAAVDEARVFQDGKVLGEMNRKETTSSCEYWR